MRMFEVRNVPGVVTQEQKETVKNQVDEILAQYRGKKADLISILQNVQKRLGYLPETALIQIAAFVDMPESTIFATATFYTQFRLIPIGHNVIKVCRGTACYVKGATRILEEFEKKLGIKVGKTTPDLEYTLESVACFGSCALAPVVLANDRVYGRVTADKKTG